MKKIMIGVSALAFCFLYYGLFAFYFLTFNPTKWSEYGRSVFVIFAGLFLVLGFIGIVLAIVEAYQNTKS